jgi:nucleoside-diphosphate-sugar epimerase
LIESLGKISGDLMILGAGGKMGISLAILAKRALTEAGSDKKVYAVSIFTDEIGPEELRRNGIEVISCDFLNEDELKSLPDVKNIIYMVGMKFGTIGQEATTWVINSYLPGVICNRFQNSKIVLFSTGNVYPFVSVKSNGCKETESVGPVGEYAQSALGRERIFQYFAEKNNISGLIFRLNYAIDLRYGVLLDIAQKVFNQKPIHLEMGYANMIWQGSANEIALRCLEHVQSPPSILNVTGKTVYSVRNIAEQYSKIFGINPVFEGQETETALLSNSSLCCEMFGEPTVSLEDMIRWIANWVKNDGSTINKPTHFETRDGKY